jgi:hypothetical protein
MSRRVRAKPGELKAYWGKLTRWDDPDFIFDRGEGVGKPDGHLLYGFLCCERLYKRWDDSSDAPKRTFIEELEARGYDMTTLRFSVMKKPKDPTKE